jgi:ketosteroid isomerase-like protein
MKRWIQWVVLAGLCWPVLAHGQAGKPEAKPVGPDDPVHKELRALRSEMLDAFNKKDVERLLKSLHPNAVVTWQNAEVSRGHDGIRDYYNKMMVGPDRLVDEVTATANVDELTILYGDRNGLAFGSLDQDFRLTNGMEFHLPNRWTAHLVKEGGRWLVAGFHVSGNLFDNPVLHTAVRRTAYWVGGGALAVGLLLGLAVAWLVRPRRRPA